MGRFLSRVTDLLFNPDANAVAERNFCQIKPHEISPIRIQSGVPNRPSLIKFLICVHLSERTNLICGPNIKV